MNQQRISALGVARDRTLFDPVTTIDELTRRLSLVHERAHLLCPFTNLDRIPPGWMVSVRSAVLNIESSEIRKHNLVFSKGEVYRDPRWCKPDFANKKKNLEILKKRHEIQERLKRADKGQESLSERRMTALYAWLEKLEAQIEVAPSKAGIAALAAICGAEAKYSVQIDDGSDPHFCRWQVRYDVLGLDGRVRPIIKTKTIDLRKPARPGQRGGEDYEKIKRWPGMLAQQRATICEIAETKASNRAHRDLGIKQKYTLAELRVKPAIAFVLVPDFDMKDEWTKRAVVASQLGFGQLLFGGTDGGSNFMLGLPGGTSARHAVEISALQDVPAREAPPPVGFSAAQDL